MAIYTKANNIPTEAIYVDSCSRITTQEAMFLNPKNVYWGLFEGRFNISSGTIANVVIDNATFRYPLKFEDLSANYMKAVTAVLSDAYVNNLSVDSMSSVTFVDLTAYNSHTGSTYSMTFKDVYDNIALSIETLSNNLSTEIDNLSAALSGEIDALSAKLSGEIDQLSTDLSGEIDSLSTSLSNGIKQLSSDLSGEIGSLSTSLSNDIKQLSSDLSGEIGSLSTSLSNDIKQLSSDLSGEIDSLSTDLSTEISSLAKSLSVEGVLVKNKLSFSYDKNAKQIQFQAYDISGNQYLSSINTRDFADDYVVSCARIENISGNNYLVIYWNTDDPTQISTAISLSAISQTYKAGNGISVTNIPTSDPDEGLSYRISVTDDLSIGGNFDATTVKAQSISAYSISVSTAKVDFANVIDENSTSSIRDISSALSSMVEDLSVDLSNAISSKIFTGNISDGIVHDGSYTNLSVVKISKEEYEQRVVAAAKNNVDLANDVLYIVSSDYIDAYGQCISNLVMTDDNIPSEATNKHYVDKLYSTLSNTYQVVSALSDAVSSTANVGDIAVVSSYISLSGNKPISRTAYYWTGNGWGALDGNYDATNIYFSDDLMYTNAIGALPEPTSGQGEISANGLNLKKVLETILVKEKSGTKTNPSITTTNSTTNVLYGTVLTPSYYFAFEDGNYQYGPDPTGSEVSSWKVKTNGNELTLPTTATSANSISNSDAACNPAQLCATFSAKALNASIYQISAYVSYTEGDVPYTNTHNPDSQASARIAASYATKSLNLYNVYKPCFWKITTTPTDNITSAAISSLSPSTGINQWNVLSNGTWKTTYDCTSPWYEIFFLAPKGIAGHSAWTGKDANNMTVKVETPIDVAFKHENVGNDNYTLFIVRNADIYGATTVTMTFN